MAASTSRLVIEISAEQAKRNAEQLNRELQSIERNGTFATRSMDAMSVATRSLAAQMTALVSVGVLISKMDTYTGLQNRLKLVTASQNELNQAMKDTFSIAQATGQAWDSTAQVYQRFADNAKRLGITLEQTASLTDTVAKSISISGGSAASAEAALVQFGQALASGVLRGEEFNSISEQAPALLKAIATGLDTNIGQLRAMAAQGQLTADVVIKSLEKAKVSVDTLFGKTDFTIGQSFQMLNNEVTKFIGEAGKASGAAKLTADSIQLLAQNLEGLVAGLQIAGAYYAGRFIPAIYASVAAGIAKAKQMADQTVVQYGLIQAEKAAAAQELANVSAKLASTEGTLAALQAERALEIQRLKAQISAQGLAASQSRLAGISQVEAQVKKELIALTAAQTAAQERLNVVQGASLGVGRGLLGLLGGPAGLAGIAVAVGTSMLLMRDNTSSATDAFDLQKQSVADLADTYSKLTSAKLVSEMDETAKKLEKAKDQIDDARSKLLGMVQGSQDYIDDRTIQQQKIMLDVLEQIKTGSIDAAKALQTLQASKAFDKNEIQQARNYFANLEEGEAVVAALTAKQQLANSALNKASGLYENLEGKARGLSEEQAQLSKELETSKTNFDFISKALLQTAQNSGVSKDGMNELKVAINQYAEDSLKATELLKLFQRYIPISNNDIETYSRLAIRVEAQKEAYARNKKELEGVNKQQAEFIKNSPNAIKGINDITEARNKEAEATRAAQRALDSYRSSALADIKEMSAKTTLLMNSSLSNNQIDYLMKALKALNYDPKLTGTDEAKQLFNLALQQAKIKDAEDKLTESRKESTKQLEKQQQILQVNAKVLEASQKYNFSGLESKYGLPNGLLASVMMQESKGNANAYNKTTGATGAFQFLSGTAKQYGVNDRTSISQAAEGAAKYFQYLLKLFGGNLEKAIRAYHAGEGNVQRGTGMGKVNDGYVKNVSGYLAGINGYSGSSKDFESFIDDQFKYTQKTLQEIDKLKADYGNADYLRQKEHEKRVADLQQHGLSDLVSKENDRYQAENTLAKLQFESQVQGWRWVGEERIKNQATVDKAVIDATRSMTDQQKLIAKAGIDEQAQYEIEQFRRTQTQKASEMQAVIAGIYDQSRNSLFERQSPNLYARNQLDVGISNEQIALTKNYGQEREAIFGRGLSADDQNAELLAAQERYLQTREALNQEYAAKESDLQKSQFQNQLQIWGSLLSQGQTMWAQLTQSVKDANGEQSGAYKTMFLAQQAFSMGSAYISAVLAAQQVAADATIPFFGAKIAASSAMMAMGMANVGLIAAQTIAGFSTGGHVRGSGTETSDSIPAMLSDNEYVIKAKSVRSLGVDTLDYINRMGELPVKRASGGSVGDTSSYIVDRYKSATQPISDGGIQIAVSVNDSGVSTSGANTQDQKQLGQMIGNAVRAVIRQEQRQGGLLAK
ncbi:tape measure protein [Acinetobacter ursingii]|uniref:tape measure protein n=1 Tax=Acinetobacter ursingii TaxID=108980 RepID=UPI00124FDF98|nr:tape measure protein [Acinetobacter ursingii]